MWKGGNTLSLPLLIAQLALIYALKKIFDTNHNVKIFNKFFRRIKNSQQKNYFYLFLKKIFRYGEYFKGKKFIKRLIIFIFFIKL